MPPNDATEPLPDLAYAPPAHPAPRTASRLRRHRFTDAAAIVPYLDALGVGGYMLAPA